MSDNLFIRSTTHSDTRAHIPSQEEAGYEKGNAKVQPNQQTDLPLNPVTTRGQDPELFWLNKYGKDGRQERLSIDIRSLYRHEHIVPENLIKGLYRTAAPASGQMSLNALFGNALDREELNKTSEYYQHPPDGWTNRLIQGDSELVMASLLEREGMAGTVQCIYFDPPYGIKYGSNWQMRLNNLDVKDGKDDNLSGEPEQIKAFRDTWELGIHSYLTYLRERLLLAKELLNESGSCFVQISDENVHLVRNLMDEVFGSENFFTQIAVKKTAAQTDDVISSSIDYIIWYAKNKATVKARALYSTKEFGGDYAKQYRSIEMPDGTRRKLKPGEDLPEYARAFRADNLTSSHEYSLGKLPYVMNGVSYSPGARYWSTSPNGLAKLESKRRLVAVGNTLSYVRFLDDFPAVPLLNVWTDTGTGGYGDEKYYVVQTTTKVIQRCILMTTDPGDLVLDPTCGSGTSAYVAEQWGRRWITIDTSRIALNIAKSRLITAVFPAYKRIAESDIRQGFVYKKISRITMRSLANDEPAEEQTLYDQPEIDKSKVRVAGPFTVETLQGLDPIAPAAANTAAAATDSEDRFEERIYDHLRSAGIKNGDATERAVFRRVEAIASSGYLHAEGFYEAEGGEKKAYLHIGPKFGAVSRQALNGAIKECRMRGDADWLVILGFQFDTDVQGGQQSTSMGAFRVDIVRMHDDLMQAGLIKNDKKAASFVTIGEPDIALIDATGQEITKPQPGQEVRVEVRGMDLYDPIRDEVKARNINDIAYWMVDDDYDGSNFVVQQVFFCGGDQDEFSKWKRGISDLAKLSTKKRAEHTLRIELDEEAFDELYGFQSRAIKLTRKGQQIAVRVISQFGEESTQVVKI
ncbi:site-specific DNA-methyltransferase [Hymenobacter canadensis]|uniref:site-specific DNA-methyltransferase (adenine-specific) n=1 Tax=Hymenobacter canadensis TaxID=2999067 RepID=A0ABY7LVC3_9BACT|nr:site-specific DNA-methyltransferase [Hymenobacter canadensis]WBA44330.1 site-specific DNA-methyltransferase [Hymenobacter canadensis]